jgi:TolB-like protein/DNA-binding winged helix-turn-helix (wHTH) protein
LLRFGPFELNPETHEFRKHGVRLRINGQTLKVLVYLLKEPGRVVTREELRAKLWSEGTFVDFDHSLNAAVNRLRERLGDSAEHSHYIETVPGVGYRFTGFVEVAPPPQSALTPISPGAAKPALQILPLLKPRMGRVLWWVLTAAMALGAVLTFALSRHTGVRSHSVALLPLQNVSHDPEQEYLADGMTDQLITELGRFRELRVISRTSTEQYRHGSTPLAKIARALRVNYIVEGAVARFANRIRINVRLVQSDTERQIWSESYEGDLGNAFVLQRNVAQAVAEEISEKLTTGIAGVESKKQVIPASAVEAYLKGKYVQAKGTQEGLYKSVAYFRQAIKTAPDYAIAHAALSQSYCALSTSYAAPRDVMPKARSAALEALRLDNTSAEAHSLMGRIAALYDWNWTDAEDHLRTALELNPSSTLAHVNRATFLVARGRVSEAISETRKAHELDPASLQNEVDLELNLFDANRFDLLGAHARQALQFDPTFPYGHTLLGWTLGHEGMLKDGIANAARGARDGGSPVQIAILGALQVMAGQRGEAGDLLSNLREQRAKYYVCAHEIAGLEAALGLNESALKSLELAYQERSDCMPFLRSDPMMNPLRSDKRFTALLQRIEDGKGIAPSQ